jgi:hypothetical protein
VTSCPMEDLRQALIAGERSGSAGPLDMEAIKRRARQGGGLSHDGDKKHVEGVARSARGSKQAEGGRGESNGERRAFANGDKLKESEWSRENHLRSFTTRKDALDAIEESWRRGPGCFELACLSGSCPGRACFFRTATGISIYIYCLGVFSRPGVMPGVAGRHFFAGSARKRAVSSRWSGGYTG